MTRNERTNGPITKAMLYLAAGGESEGPHCKGRFGEQGGWVGGSAQGGFINLEFSDRIWAFLGVAHVDKKTIFE